MSRFSIKVLFFPQSAQGQAVSCVALRHIPSLPYLFLLYRSHPYDGTQVRDNSQHRRLRTLQSDPTDLYPTSSSLILALSLATFSLASPHPIESRSTSGHQLLRRSSRPGRTAQETEEFALRQYKHVVSRYRQSGNIGKRAVSTEVSLAP